MKFAVLGAAGRMGQALTRMLVETPGCAVAGGIEAKGSPLVGRDLGEVAGLDPLGIAITDDPLPVFAHVDGVLDFTKPGLDRRLRRTFGASPHRPCHRHDRPLGRR